MQNGKMMKALKIACAAALAATAAACASTEDLSALEAKVSALERKANEAMQNSAAAKIDASTALHMTTEKK